MKKAVFDFKLDPKKFFYILLILSLIGSIASTIAYIYHNRPIINIIVNITWFIMSAVSVLLVFKKHDKAGISIFLYFLLFLRYFHAIIGKTDHSEITIFNVSQSILIITLSIIVIGFYVNKVSALIYTALSSIYLFLLAVLYEEIEITASLGIVALLLIIIYTVYYISNKQSEIYHQSKRNEQKYLSLIDEMYNGFAYCESIVDEKGEPIDHKFLEINKSFEKITGIKKDKIINKTAKEVFNGIESSNFDWAKNYGDVAKTGISKDFGNMYFEPLGKWFAVSAYSIEKGYFATVFKDVTNEELTKRQMNRERKKALEYLDIAGVILVVTDRFGDITLVNQKGCELVGCISEKLIGKNIFDVYVQDPVNKQILKKLYSEVIAGVRDMPSDQNIPYIMKTGERKIFHWKMSGIKDRDGNTIGLITSGNDITELKDIQETLRKSEELFRTMFEESSIGLVLFNNDGTTNMINKAALNMLGTQDIENAKRDMNLFNMDYVSDKSKRIIKSEKVLYVEHKTDVGVLRRNFPDVAFDKLYDRHFSICILPIYTTKDKEKLRGYLLQAVETTKQKQVEAKLKASNEELEQYAHTISHDLKNPIIAIMSYIKLIYRKYEDVFDDENKMISNEVLERSERLLDMIDDLLNYSKLNSTQINYQAVNVNDVLKSAIENIIIDIDKKNADIEYDNMPDMIIADKTLLVSIFQNLISNAVKYCDKLPKIRISYEENDTHWIFKIADNGIGISKADKEKIFNLFHRIENENDAYSGYGIGLSMCKKIVEKHQGTITVESVLGEGSTFIFTIDKSLVAKKSVSFS